MNEDTVYGRCRFLNSWPGWALNVHETKEQIARQDHAASLKMPIYPSFDSVNRIAQFSTSSTLPYYETTLAGCNCPDFQERKLPCKHMYRLAAALGVIEIMKQSEQSRPDKSAGLYKTDHLNEILFSDAIHEHEEQRVRQRNARKCQIISIDKDRREAIFKGSGKKPYTTSPDGYTCQDFGMRKLPCKHIYKLMHELGEFNLDAVPAGRESETSSPREPITAELVSIVDSLSLEAKEELYYLVREWIAHACSDDWLYERDNRRVIELVNAGLLEEFDAPEKLLSIPEHV